jgi:DNA-binding CsgD family transcriptional regulator
MASLADSSERVVQRFFEAAAAPDLWPEALHELAQACGAEGAAAHASRGLETFATVGSRGVAELHDAFVKRWKAPELNSHRARGMVLIRRGWRGALTEQHCFTSEDLAHDPFQQDFFVRSGFSSFAGIILGNASGLSLSVSVIRRIRQGQYSRGEVAFINKLSGHLRAASAVALRLGIDSTRRLSDAYAMAGNPVALLGRDGHVMHMTAQFERLLANGVDVRDGRLESWQAEADNALTAAVERAVKHDRVLRDPLGSVVLPRKEGLRPLVAQVIPVVGRAQDIFQLVSAIVVLTDLEEASAAGPLEPLLQRAFGLTPAEARLAAAMSSGKTLPEISRAAGVSHETMRSRLKSVFEKTGTSRQTQLVHVLSRLARTRLS